MIVGRFELKRVLGEGAQATVWLGFDARLEREVAVKLMRADAASDADAVSQWLQEARSVSRLTHPHIVPVFEADMHGRQPYLVFEYVPGQTLSQQLKSKGAMAAQPAVVMMLGVLDALAAAHAAGVVHRDLKPSNILVDVGGRARVMDFGIAARLHDPGNLDQVVGTPGYMSPEATQGGLPTATMDVFSAGLVLVELLSGDKLVKERDPYRAMHRVANEDLALPGNLSSDADDALRVLLLRALARNPAKRWADAAAFRDALQHWLAAGSATEGAAAPTANAGAGQANGTLDFLLRRMRHKSDFPALSDSVVRIQRVADSENESVGSLSNEILKDVALTNKLLRMVNTAHFSSAGGSISTVSRAVALIGFAGIRNMAMSLVLLEHMHDKAHANQLKEEFLRSLMAGMLASELGGARREGEEAFIGAMFQNLGRLLTEYYFAEEARQVRGVVAGSASTDGTVGALKTEEAASLSVLGLSFEALGLGVAKVWGLPTTLQACMRRPKGEPPTREPQEVGERLRWLTFAANQISDALLRSPPEVAAARVAEVANRHARALGTDAAHIAEATALAQHRLSELARAMNIQIPANSPAKRLFATPAASAARDAASGDHDSLTPHELHATLPMPLTMPVERAALDNATEVLAAGIQDITNAMVENFKLNDVLKMILETMFRALGFRRVVFCLRDQRTGMITGRFGLGEGAEAVAAAFKVPLTSTTDLFTAVCKKGADTLITDATVPQIHARMPPWFRERVDAPAFLLLPMMLKGAPFALIYADKAVAGGITLGEKELSLLRTLRNQAVMAFKQVL